MDNSNCESKSITLSSYVAGVGYALPERVISNDYFSSYLETNDQWIIDRTGIKERRWVEPGVAASDLALPACKRALESANLTPKDVDGIVVATVTPDLIFPSTGCIIQAKLGAKGFAFDVNAVCCGFLYAFSVADGLIASGQARRVLVVGVDVYSTSMINHEDRGTCILFGDGAGAVVLSSAREFLEEDSSLRASGPTFVQGSSRSLRGVYNTVIGADGSYGHILKAEMGTACPVTPEHISEHRYHLQMEGREVFKLAVRTLADVNLQVLKNANLSIADVNYLATHQANKRILQSVSKQLAIPDDKVLMNVDRVGNTSSASVPILLGEAVEQGKLKRGDLVILSAFGGGVTWGASLVRW